MSRFFEEIKVNGQKLVETVERLVHEGNVRRIIIRNEQGHTILEIPVTVAIIGAVLAPELAAVGALAAMAARFTLVVEKTAEKTGESEPPSSAL